LSRGRSENSVMVREEFMLESSLSFGSVCTVRRTLVNLASYRTVRTLTKRTEQDRIE
jgi:hypothetical protein